MTLDRRRLQEVGGEKIESLDAMFPREKADKSG